MNTIGKAIIYSTLGQYSVHILTFATIVTLARLLTPEEIGTYAVAGSIALLATELRSMGVAQFLVREKELDETKIRSALGLTIAVSWGLGTIIAVMAPIAADFYGEPVIRNILWILCASFVFGPFTSVPTALWTRNMQFQTIFVLKFFSAVTYSASTIIFVLLDFSYYGLALGVTVGFITELVIAICLQPAGTVWIPSISGVGKLVKFGMYTSSNSLFARFSESIPDLVIGRIATMADVGIFSRGLGAVLFMLKIITSAVAPVVLPHLSKVDREGKSLADAYLKAINLQAAFSWPIFAVVSVAAYPMIRALFGDQWDAAIPITSIIAVWAVLASMHCFSTQALIASGGEKLVFVTGLIIVIFRFVGVLITVPYGLETVAWAVVASGVVEVLIKTWALKKSIGLCVSRLVVQFIPNMIIMAVCWLVAITIDQMMPFTKTNPFLSIVVIFVCLSVTWLLLLRVTRHEAWDIAMGLFASVTLRKKSGG